MEEKQSTEDYKVTELARVLKHAGYNKKERKRLIKTISREQKGSNEAILVASAPVIFTAGLATIVGTFLGTYEVGNQMAKEISSLIETNFITPYLQYCFSVPAILSEFYLFKKIGKNLIRRESEKIGKVIETVRINSVYVKDRVPLPQEIIEGGGKYKSLGLENLIPT